MNNVLAQSDKRGGRPYSDSLLKGFQDVLQKCDLVDMVRCGYQYTWERGSNTANHVEVRLERAIVSHDFLSLFQEAKLTNLEVSTSDHCPIMLETQVIRTTFTIKPFRFENAWLREPMRCTLVEYVWQNNPSISFYDKLQQCSEILSV